MTIIGARIRKLREDKNISQEKMAMELILTQSNYGRLEKDDKRLTAPKLQKIAEVLDVSIAHLFGEKTSKVIHQTNNEKAEAYNVDTIIQADKEHIRTLKEEIQFLRQLIENKKGD
jgi:transcriptional regulator with XRE-family HTH domain